ncbi:MAG: class I SAM-dependent methyltransferase [Pseudomonadota bacterium]|nr:class I SAM-dependent methyltransferase [Pseudomonadota bacterium]
MTDRDESLLNEQAAYYRARAPEYDEWWQRSGRYDHGPDATSRWNAEVAQVAAELAGAALTGDVLELASGTGWWTEHLARTAGSLTCIDASPETIDINRARLTSAGLPLPRYEIADLFQWTPSGRFDAVFFSFWLSHVPNDRFASFWTKVAAALRPGGRAFFIDSLPEQTTTANNHRMPDEDGIQERRLNDGRTFRIVKLFRGPDELAAGLQGFGWKTKVGQTPSYFVFGQAEREPSRAA